eukprot:6821_1
MNLLSTVTTFILISISKSQNASQCTGIYNDNLEIYALDICVTNTLLGFPINQRYVCENGQIQSHYWYYNNGANCNGVPDSENRVDIHANKTVCEGVYNCPYSIIRVYEYNNYCQDYGIWSDRAIIMEVCQPNTNESSSIGGLKLRCDRNRGVVQEQYSELDCTGEFITDTIIFPSTGNDTCVNSININGVYAKFKSCNERSNATAPIPYPTESPTPRPSAGGSYSPSLSPTQPTMPPTPETTDETWFITALVFICMFGVLLCCMVWLGYTTWQQPSRGRKSRHYDKAPTDDEVGVETTNQM